MGLHVVGTQPTPEAAWANFKPSGFNDDRRVDFTGLPFLAVDTPNPFEVDDAFYVEKSSQGAFLARVAIVDGSQLIDSPDLMARATAKRASVYGETHDDVDPMLPVSVIRQLELSTERRRALVISRTFTPEARADGKVTVEPGWVAVRHLTPDQFTRQYTYRSHRGKDRPAATFARMWASNQGLKFIYPKTSNATEYGMNHVQSMMVNGNGMFVEWADVDNVPILRRTYSPRVTVWDEDRRQHIAYGQYTVERTLHYGLAWSGGRKYTHVSSILRRVADAYNHLQAAPVLAGQEPPLDRGALEDIGRHLTKPFYNEPEEPIAA